MELLKDPVALNGLFVNIWPEGVPGGTRGSYPGRPQGRPQPSLKAAVRRLSGLANDGPFDDEFPLLDQFLAMVDHPLLAV